MTTPEQEALADALARCAKGISGARGEQGDYAAVFPLAADFDADEPTGATRHLVRSFAKSFEILKDQVTRRLPRSVLAVARLPTVGGHPKIDIGIGDVADLIGLGAAVLRDLTIIRNNLAHEYAMEFADVAPILNRARRALTVLIEIVATIDVYVRGANLLKDAS